jgi:hypothetical protein
MGSLNCCSNNTILIPKKNLDLEITEKSVLDKVDEIKLKKNFTKKNTFIFDKKNFIPMKTSSLNDDYELKEKLGEGAYWQCLQGVS